MDNESSGTVRACKFVEVRDEHPDVVCGVLVTAGHAARHRVDHDHARRCWHRCNGGLGDVERVPVEEVDRPGDEVDVCGWVLAARGEPCVDAPVQAADTFSGYEKHWSLLYFAAVPRDAGGDA